MKPLAPDVTVPAAGKLPGGVRTGPLSFWQQIPAMPMVLAVLLLGIQFLQRVRDNPRLAWSFAGASIFLLAWALLLWARARRTGRGFRIDIVPPRKQHYIQSSVQVCLYIYWGWYWRAVYAEVPLILGQLLFLYAFDALLTWSRGRNWQLGFGPLPIILSTNVFIWFIDDWYAFQFLLVATGAMGKEFIRWNREGRRTHIFNPSSFTLALFSLVLLFTGTTNLTMGSQIATTVFRPPHIYLEIFLLGLIVQYFFSVTLITVSAAAVVILVDLLYFQATGTYFFIDSSLPVPILIGFTLLVTDPSTSPRTNAGRLIFGVGYGIGAVLLFWLFERLGVPSFYDKLLPVPVLNLSVQAIDRLAKKGLFARWSRWEERFGLKRANYVYMGCWSAVFLVMLGTHYVERPHPGASIEFWKQAVAEGRHGAEHGLATVVQFHADQGDPVAWNELGMMYSEGLAVPKNLVSAAKCFSNASRLGNDVGTMNLVTQFLFLEGAEDLSDVAAALDRLEQACGDTRGDGRTCFLLGVAYEAGKGRRQDTGRAKICYQQGCARKDPDACDALRKLQVREAISEPEPEPK